MALPTLLKTWQLNINNTALSAAELPFHQQLLFDLKEAMTGFALNPWVVKGSSDSVAFGVGDNVDRWTIPADIVWNAGNHSWIVLENISGFQVCFASDFGSNVPEDLYVYASPSAGFVTGGSVSARPTASDEYDMLTGPDAGFNWFGNQQNAPVNNVWHMWHSSDGALTYMVAMVANNVHTFWAFGEIGDPIAGHTNPYLGTAYTNNSFLAEKLTVPNFSDLTQIRSEYAGTRMEIYATGAGMVNANIMERTELSMPEEIGGEMVLTEIGLVSTTVGSRGVKGKLTDIFWGQYQVALAGDTYPNNALAREFVQIGHWVFPWTGDATIPQTA